MKHAWLLTLSAITFGCTANQGDEPESVILHYGKSELVAQIQANEQFEAQINNDQEQVDFSGFVRKQSSGYLVDVIAMQESKTQHSSSSVNTQVLIKEGDVGKPLMIGAVNDNAMSVTLK